LFYSPKTVDSPICGESTYY